MMFGAAMAAVVSFISTNIDNIFVLILLYAQVDENFKKSYVVIGQYLAIAVLYAFSLLSAFGLNFISQKYVGLLGIIPIAIGIKELISYGKSKNTAAAHEDKPKVETGERDNIQTTSYNERRGKWHRVLKWTKSAVSIIIRPEILNVMLAAIANGADNIGVYIPLFTGYSSSQLIITALIFAVMMALWCFLVDGITSFPKVKNVIQRYKHIVVPIVFIGLGIYIIVKGFLIIE